jgi:hypothetical protein
MRYKTVAISADIVEQTRKSLKSPQYGHPAYVKIATGYGPCRSCLQVFNEGKEERIMFTFDPFADKHTLPSPGPVFIHREPCIRYDEESFPESLRSLPLTLEGLRTDGLPVARQPVSSAELDETIDRIFAEPGVEYIHVRNSEAGCFIARLERLAETSESYPTFLDT